MCLKNRWSPVLFAASRPVGLVRILLVEWYDDVGVKVSYKLSPERKEDVLLSGDELRLDVAKPGGTSPFDDDRHSWRLAPKAGRIKPSNLFDRFLVIRTSRIEPLPPKIGQTEASHFRGLVTDGTCEGDVYVRHSLENAPDPQTTAFACRPAEHVAPADAPA